MPMGTPPAAAVPKPCCVCDAPNGKHCAKCKSRHYCSKKCQLVDWNEGGHKAQCRRLAAEFQDRLLDELMPAKMKIKEEPPIVQDVAPAAGSTAAPRLSAAVSKAAVFKARAPALRAETTLVMASAPNGDTPDWRGTCAICLDVLPLDASKQMFHSCCCKSLCKVCSVKCLLRDVRCPLCRTPASTSDAETLRRVQVHVDKGNAEAQVKLGSAYHFGNMGLKKSPKRMFQLYEAAALQGHANAQYALGEACYNSGQGVKMDYAAAAHWLRRAAEQGHPGAQLELGALFFEGKGVAQSYDDSVRWYRLAVAQGNTDAQFHLGACYEDGRGVPRDLHEALRLFKRAAAQGHGDAARAVDDIRRALA